MRERIAKIAPFFVFVFLLTSTFYVWKTTQNIVNVEVEQHFTQEVQVVKHWIQDRLNLYLPIALATRIFFESSDAVTADEWSSYIQRLKLIDKYPAISSLTYIEWDRDKGEDAYIVKYIEPSGALNGNQEAVGFDISTDQKKLDLFNSVRDDDPTSTGRVALITTS